MSNTIQVEPLFSKKTEEALIGSVLICPDILRELDIKPEQFYIHGLRFIWQAIARLSDNGSVIDFVTVCEELERAGKMDEIGGNAYLAGLINFAPSYLHAIDYANIIKDLSARRQWLEIANQMAKSAYDRETELIYAAPGILTGLSSAIQINGGAVHVGQFAGQVLAEAIARRENPTDFWGMRTGFIDYDTITGGLQPGEMLVISGKPGLGKSIMAMQMGFQLAEQNYPGALYSLEMPGQQVLRRRLSAMANVPTRSIKTGRLDDEQFDSFLKAIQASEQLPIYISDSVHWTTASLRADLARMKAQYQIEWFALDYAYLLQDGKGLSETDKTGLISAQMKSICRGLNLAGIVIISLRKTERNALPEGDDLRGSGQQFYDPDVLLFLAQGEQKNILTCIFGKGRELERPKQSFDLIRKPGYPALANAVVEHIDLSGNGRNWQSRKDLT